MPIKKKCEICAKDVYINRLFEAEIITPELLNHIQNYLPYITTKSLICDDCLENSRYKYVSHILEEGKNGITKLEKEVARSIRKHNALSENIENEFQKELTFGEKIADKVAEVGGSWRFISCFLAFMALWIIANVIFLAAGAFDPFPFILLNLTLSCLAALQAPVIMMSQRRQEERDRLRSQMDYKVNLKAELEIQHLHEKLDLLLKHQWGRLMEIQRMQVEMLSNKNIKTPKDQFNGNMRSATASHPEKKEDKRQEKTAYGLPKIL